MGQLGVGKVGPVWGVARGQGHSGTRVGHEDKLRATVGPVWGTGRGGQSRLYVEHGEGWTDFVTVGLGEQQDLHGEVGAQGTRQELRAPGHPSASGGAAGQGGGAMESPFPAAQPGHPVPGGESLTSVGWVV